MNLTDRLRARATREIESRLRALAHRLLLAQSPSWRAAQVHPPGHFYSPLLDLSGIGPETTVLPHDGAELWEHVDLNEAQLRAYYQRLLRRHPPLAFPPHRSKDFRYFTENNYFPCSDAYTLSAILREERPRQIVEVGSGFSTAVMLDTLDAADLATQITCIEPYPERLMKLLRPADQARVQLLCAPVQEVDPELFNTLQAGDILFVDSSHVAKVGSDVAVLLLRVLPRLAPGVLVHFHDIVYPHSYPMPWIRNGWAWNESLMLRALLIGNPALPVLAFNSFAANRFPELFTTQLPHFLGNPGSSFWLRTGPTARAA